MGLRPVETAPADAVPDVTVTAERITEESRAREVLDLFRKADHVTVLALPDLSGVIADCDTGADTALSAEFFFERYTGDWNALLNALFAADIKKVSHNVKDLMRTLLENGLNADGFMFDTALAAYLVDATSGKYEISQLFAGYFHTELVKPVHLEPDAFSLLGDVTAAEAAFHSYTSAVDALYEVLAPKLKELDLWDLYATAELPLCRVLAEMELAGCRVDRGALAAFGEMLSKRPPLWNRIFTIWLGRNSTSTPPSSWERFCSASWACHTARKRKPAGPPMLMYWKSCSTRPPSWGRCWNTGNTRN